MAQFQSRWSLLASSLAALAVAALASKNVAAQFAQDDAVVGTSNSGDPPSTFRVFDKSSGTWSNGPGWSSEWIQSVEFDNAAVGGMLTSHNPNGNLLAANFGNSFTGFEVYNLATNGGAAATSVWSIVEATGGTKGVAPGSWLSQRGGGLAVSPGNSYVAWFNSDSGEIYVHNYLPGGTPGTGADAVMSGPRHTGLGDGAGAGGSVNALKVGATQGGTWLNDYTLLSFNGFGELVQVDLRDHTVGGTENGTFAGWAPEVMTDWKIVNSEVSFDAQYTDVEYNPAVDPAHIYASVTKSDFSATLYAFDYDAATGAISLNRSLDVPDAPNGDPREPREIGFDSQGNLLYSGYAGSGSNNLVMKFNNATDVANWDAADITVLRTDSQYSPYNGLDVANGLALAECGDVNMDGVIDATDFQALVDNWSSAPGEFKAYWQGDLNRDGVVSLADLVKFNENFTDGDANFDGVVDIFDVAVISNNWGASGPLADVNEDGTVDIFDVATVSNNWSPTPETASVPEPSALALMGMAAIGAAFGLRRRRSA